MSDFQPIIATLEYETSDYRTLKLHDADISAHLILALDTDENVESFADNPYDCDYFGEVVANDLALNEEGWQFAPSIFSLHDELVKATAGRYGDDLLSMWHGWKAEALAASVVLQKSAEVATAAANGLHNQVTGNVFLQGEHGLRILFATLLQQNGGFEALQAELSEGDYSPIEAMTTLGKLQA